MCAQLLLPKVDGGRVAVHEILIRTSALQNIIREGDASILATMIQNGKARGMQTMDDALAAALAAGNILADDAYRKAEDKGRFEKLLEDSA